MDADEITTSKPTRTRDFHPKAPRRIPAPGGHRLPVIMENGVVTASRDPSRSSNPPRYSWADRPWSRRGLRRGSSGSNDTLPPAYSKYAASAASEEPPITSADREKLATLRNNKQIAKRGGWKRLALLLLLAVVVVVAIAVGVTVGLKKKNSVPSTASTDPAITSPPSPSVSPAPQFPLGTYSMVTFLDTVSTNCTAIPATWTCFPYTTYNQSPTQSQATFDWTITSVSALGQYQIASTNNPFAVSFTNQSLQLVDQGQSTERYTFKFSMDKQVVPTASITSDNSGTTCFYNQTTFQASLYTKMAKSYPSSSPSANVGSYPLWPYAVRVEQLIRGGTDVPNCYKTMNGGLGARVTTVLQPQDSGQTCGCLYRNSMGSA
ncbi:hypothetical protein B0A49_06562 [Cryomyces minteri]|uniref:Tat pathway signal sequence n=1 Tax=Cryomyces minteri TaxID=331657 RepID=A0A4U0WYD0_9PEZI|nr:hypothetical protein B0A49_06562 [Cryomyces minteri]